MPTSPQARQRWRIQRWCLVLVCALLVGLTEGAVRADPLPVVAAKPGAVFLPSHLGFLPPTPRLAVMLGDWPSDTELAALSASLPASPPAGATPQEVFGWAFARDQVALMQQLSPVVTHTRAGANEPFPALVYAESRKHLGAVPEGVSAELDASRAVVLAAEGRHAEALLVLEALLKKPPPKASADWLAGLAVYTLHLRGFGGQWGLVPQHLDPLLHSPHWAAVVEALYLEAAPHLASPPEAVARHAVAWVERLHNNGALAAGVPLAELRQNLQLLAAASFSLPEGWLLVTDALRLLPDPLRLPLMSGLLSFYEASAPPLHLGYLHLFLFEAPPEPPPADRIGHLEAASLLATEPPKKKKPALPAPSAQEASVLCDGITAQLRASRPWWVAWSKLPDQRAKATSVLQRCLAFQADLAVSSGDLERLFEVYDGASAHLGAFRALDLARYALALGERGDASQAYEIIKQIPEPDRQKLPLALRESVRGAHVALALRLNKDLKPANLSCASLAPLPPSPEQEALLASLGATPSQGEALLALQLSVARYADAVGTLRAVLSSVAEAERPGLVASTARCLHDARQYPLLAGLASALDVLDPVQRLSVLKAATAGRPSTDLLIQDAHQQLVVSWVLSSPANGPKALKLLTELQGRWSHAALSPALLLTLAELQRGTGQQAEALLSLDTLQAVYPADPLADDALWLAANLLLEQKKPEQARALLLKIISDHPSGSHLWRANDLLEHILEIK